MGHKGNKRYNETMLYSICKSRHRHFCTCTRVHHSDVIMSAMTSQSADVSIACSSVCSGADQRKHQSSTSLAFVKWIHRWPVDSPHKGPVKRSMFHLVTSSYGVIPLAIFPYMLNAERYQSHSSMISVDSSFLLRQYVFRLVTDQHPDQYITFRLKKQWFSVAQATDTILYFEMKWGHKRIENTHFKENSSYTDKMNTPFATIPRSQFCASFWGWREIWSSTDAGKATWIIMAMHVFEACVHHRLNWVLSP